MRSSSVALLPEADGSRRRVSYSEIARVNPWVRAAVNARAGVASRVPMHVFRPLDADGERERVRSTDGGAGAQLAALVESPGVSGRRFRRQLIGDMLTHGNALAQMLFSGGLIAGLRRQPWDDVEPHLTDEGLDVESFEVPVERATSGLGRRLVSETTHLDPADVIHLTLDDDTDGPLGVSPLAALHATHALHEAVWRFALQYLTNGVFPSGVVELPAQATQQAARYMVELMNELHAGLANAGAPLPVAGKWHQVSASPEGARIIELAKQSREEVSAAYQVDLSMMGDTGNSNKATAIAVRQRFVRDIVGGDVAILESEFNHQLVRRQTRWRQAGLWVEANMWELLRPDAVELSQVIQREVGGPVLTPNDGRRLLNLRPLEDPRADRLILNPGTPDGEVDPDDPAADPDDGGEGEGTASTPENIGELVNALGVLIRSGFKPAAALEALGLDPIEHWGLLPVTVQAPDEDDV